MKSVCTIKPIWLGLDQKELRKKVSDHYSNNLSQTNVVNLDRGILIRFTNQPGRNKLAYGARMDILKANVVRHLKTVLSKAIYSNWGNRKVTDNKEVVGYLNFKVAVDFEGYGKKHLRIAIQLRRDGCFYYNHEINVIRS